MSVLTATVLLTFALTHFLSDSAYGFGVRVFGSVLRFKVDLRTAIVILTSGLTAMGMDWLLQSHPMARGKRTVEHWFAPMLTTLVLGVPLYLLPLRTFWWWVGLGVGGGLLVLVFWSEYVVVSPGDPAYPTATVVLSVISFTLYLILALVLRYANVRLFLLAPAFFGATFLVSLRTLHLRLVGRWLFGWSLGIALVGVQLAAGLHYLPLSPVRYGIFLLAFLYALTNLAASLSEGMPLKRAAVEPAVMLVFVWGLGVWLG